MEKAQIIGRIGNDAEMKDVAGNRVIEFTVAVSKKIKGVDTTTWYKVQKWLGKNQGEGVFPYLKKGTQVYVDGGLACRAWVSNGEARCQIEIRALEIQLLSSGKSAESQPYDAKALATAPPEQGSPDDLPF